MFGYIICDRKGLEKDELVRYRSFYCGICRALNEYGAAERLYLNYDMTLLAIFLSSLYEPEEELNSYRCIIHPAKKQNTLKNRFIDYAAAMTIALAYHKNMDDWIDDKKLSARKYMDIIRPSYEKVKKLYPRQCECIEKSLDRLHFIESTPCSPADEAILESGKMLSELFVYKDDFWAEDLRRFGTDLGRFIYLMDATMDYTKDMKKCSYNPLRIMNRRPEDMEELLRIELGNAADTFERLPLVSDVHLLRNIIYSGVWQKFDAKGLGKENRGQRKGDGEPVSSNPKEENINL